MKQDPKQRREHLERAFSRAPSTGHLLEFGVGEGHSLRWIRRFANDKTIHGFDSFEGLPEQWHMHPDYIVPKGSWKYDPPDIDNVVLHIGLFEDTLPKWVAKHPGMIAFLHFDADLYSSCVTVLEYLNHQIVPGTVIVFDDMFETERYQNWREGEHRAFEEWKKKYNRKAHLLEKTTDGEASYRILA